MPPAVSNQNPGVVKEPIVWLKFPTFTVLSPLSNEAGAVKTVGATVAPLTLKPETCALLTLTKPVQLK